MNIVGIGASEAKRAVAQAKARAREDMYDKLETREGEKRIFALAREREKSTKNFTHIKQVKNKEGRVLVDDNEIKERWKEYFKTLLNEENPRAGMDEGEPNDRRTTAISREEVKQALRGMNDGKATGPDNIPVEVWKSLEEEGIGWLCWLLNKIYEKEKIPDAWRCSDVVQIYKEKGDIQDCKNYRGIKLMSHTMKLYERIIERRVRGETLVGDEQFGFMPGRSTTDAIFALRQLLEKYGEKQRELHLIFIDLEKAYDRVPRQEVWASMRRKGASEKYVRVIQDMYEGSRTRVRSSVGTTEEFGVRVGLHQGSSLSPYLFNLLMDDSVQNIKEEAPWTMLFADDIVLVDESRDGVERKLERWRRALEERGLRISREKTEYLNFNGRQESEVWMQDVKLKGAKEFRYLGSHIAADGSLDGEISHRIQSGWKNWKRTTGVLCDRKISARVKGKVFKSVVRPAMLYGAETWPIKRAQESKLEVAEMRMLRWMLGVTRRDKVRNSLIRGTAKVTEVTKKVQERRMQWFGHIKRREEEYVGRRILDMEVEGRRQRGRPKKRWKDCIGEDLRERGLREEDVGDRALWRRLARNSDPI